MLASQVIEYTHSHPATPDQIGKAHKCFSGSTSFYLVETSQDGLDGRPLQVDEDGALIEYRVSYSKKMGFRCSCKAGEHAKLCWHVRAAIGCEEEVKAAMKEQIALSSLNVCGKPADQETLTRVANATPQDTNVLGSMHIKPFSARC
jgi:hypothetical protein